MSSEKTTQEMIQREINQEQLAYRAVLNDIQNVLATKHGRNFMKYLFENFEVGTLPEVGYPEHMLKDRLGFLRAGSEIFRIVAVANPEVACTILAQIEKEKYEQTSHDETRSN